MTPLMQNDPRLQARPSIKTHGCYFRALSQICEKAAGKVLTERQIIDQYDWCLDNGAMVDERGKQAFVLDPTKVGRAAQFYLQVPQTFRAVSRESVPGYDKHDFLTNDPASFWLALGKIEGAGILHFWEIDENRVPLWDSLWPVRQKLEIMSVRGFAV